MLVTLNPKLTVRIDKEDLPLISKYNWYLHKWGNNEYAHSATFSGRSMHRLVLQAKPGQIIDHIDGNGLNNEKKNLRIVDHAINMQNRRPCGKSKYLGVYQDKGRSRWRATLTFNRKTVYLGTYDTEIEAAVAYDKAVVERYGEAGKTNFPHKPINTQ